MPTDGEGISPEDFYYDKRGVSDRDRIREIQADLNYHHARNHELQEALHRLAGRVADLGQELAERTQQLKDSQHLACSFKAQLAAADRAVAGYQDRVGELENKVAHYRRLVQLPQSTKTE